MKKMPNSKAITDDTPDELLPEYQFDYSKAKPNRFADHMTQESIVVILDPDVAEVFRSPEAVNKVLRALIATMPKFPNPSR